MTKKQLALLEIRYQKLQIKHDEQLLAHQQKLVTTVDIDPALPLILFAGEKLRNVYEADDA